MSQAFAAANDGKPKLHIWRATKPEEAKAALTEASAKGNYAKRTRSAQELCDGTARRQSRRSGQISLGGKITFGKQLANPFFYTALAAAKRDDPNIQQVDPVNIYLRVVQNPGTTTPFLINTTDQRLRTLELWASREQGVRDEAGAVKLQHNLVGEGKRGVAEATMLVLLRRTLELMDEAAAEAGTSDSASGGVPVSNKGQEGTTAIVIPTRETCWQRCVHDRQGGVSHN